MVNWKDLIVTDCDGGKVGTLLEVVENNRHMLKSAKIFPGNSMFCAFIEEWPYYFLTYDGEKEVIDTLHAPIEWEDFKEYLEKEFVQ